MKVRSAPWVKAIQVVARISRYKSEHQVRHMHMAIGWQTTMNIRTCRVTQKICKLSQTYYYKGRAMTRGSCRQVLPAPRVLVRVKRRAFMFCVSCLCGVDPPNEFQGFGILLNQTDSANRPTYSSDRKSTQNTDCQTIHKGSSKCQSNRIKVKQGKVWNSLSEPLQALA